MATEPCPCGSGADATACCAVHHDGVPAPTALALMRSRYTAFVRSEIDYLIATHDPETRGEIDRDALARWARDTEWRGLEILEIVLGEPGDVTGVVEFVATGATRGTPFRQHERSRFRRAGDAWLYVDGKVINEPARRVVTAGRNDPCPCGSGMKYKRCHGA